ncbi:hypothetical protein EYV94_26820 [Puteibacter caeruleilacunae]|nr:hypothetical protein EYV94_26820 [Puteibacter caeruleilacunae]
MKHITIFFFCFFSTLIGFGQSNISKDLLYQQFIEELLSADNEDQSSLLEEIEYLYHHPLDINNATNDELSQLFFLDSYQIASILLYRQEQGGFVSPFEFIAIDGLTTSEAKYLSLFTCIGDIKESPTKPSLKYIKHEIVSSTSATLEKQKGYQKPYDEGGFKGNHWKKYLRWTARSGKDMEVGTTMETDPGEPFFKSPNKAGFDYYSFHAIYSPRRTLQTIVVGDYICRTGLGLSLWSGYGIRKSASLTSVTMPQLGLAPYRSSRENHFLRGIGTQFKWKEFQLVSFFSSRKADALLNIRGDSIISIQSSGYHRTSNELDRKNNIVETIYGTSLLWSHNRWRAQLNVNQKQYSKAILPGSRPYQRYNFSAKTNSNISTTLFWVDNGINVSTETAISSSSGIATLQKVILSPAILARFSIIHRYYQRNYHSNMGSSFTENNLKNEHGLYIGTELLPCSHWKINAYFDSWKCPWLNYNNISPSNGKDYLVQFSFSPSGKHQCYLRIKEKTEDHNGTASTGVKKEYQTTKTSMRLNHLWQVNPYLSIQNRMEQVTYHTEITPKEKGWLLFAQLNWSPQSQKLKLNYRFSWFKTASYNTRVYSYENDLLYALSTPSMFGQGIRSYLNCAWNISSSLALRGKLAYTYYSHQQSIGSGLTLIDAPHKTELKLQARIKF